MFHMKMHWLIVNGLTEDNQLKQNGNMQLELIKMIIYLLGVTILIIYILMQILGKEISLLQTHKGMVMKD